MLAGTRLSPVCQKVIDSRLGAFHVLGGSSRAEANAANHLAIDDDRQSPPHHAQATPDFGVNAECQVSGDAGFIRGLACGPPLP